MCDKGHANAKIAAKLPVIVIYHVVFDIGNGRTINLLGYLPAVKTANTGLPVVVLSYVIDLVNTFHSGEARFTRTVKSKGQSSVKARHTPATVTAANTGHTHPADLASSSVVTGKAASILFLESFNILI